MNNAVGAEVAETMSESIRYLAKSEHVFRDSGTHENSTQASTDEIGHSGAYGGSINWMKDGGARNGGQG